jgi:hypothetical protein
METIRYSLGGEEPEKPFRIIRIIFGAVCIAVSAGWIVFGPAALRSGSSFWITVLFLAAFGLYQVWGGIGRSAPFIELTDNMIILRRHTVGTTIEIAAGRLEQIELFPMKAEFTISGRSKIVLRFGAMYQETNETIKDQLILFSQNNDIPCPVTEEKL